jgi:hypothetical protein
MIGIGPVEKWEHDLRKLDRAALVHVAQELHFHLRIYRRAHFYEPDFDIDMLIHRARIYGRHDNVLARTERYQADPEKYLDQMARRTKSAKAAARRRKKRGKA